MDSLGIYISVPFCRSKCTYCNFASGVFPSELHQPYVERLCSEIAGIRPRATEWGVILPAAVDSVYWGGGTPAVLGGPLLGRIWHAIRSQFEISTEAEVTMECAPGLLDDSSLDVMLEGGLNRVSFGVQSFVDQETRASGRLHGRETALAELERVRTAGIGNISIDLIAGLPYQNRRNWLESLDILAETGAGHASIYALEVDEDSRLGREMLAGGERYHAGDVPDDDRIAELYEAAIDRLGRHGLRQYEISNFARPGCESRHNRKYWLRQPYLGFGLDAHSMLRRAPGSVLRFRTGDQLQIYLSGKTPLTVDELTREEEFSEAWFLGLRLRDGVRWDALNHEFGRERVEPLRPLVGELVEDGLLEEKDGRIRLTPRGVLLSNEVFVRFV